MKFLYNAGIYLLSVLAKMLSPFSSKIRLWLSGTKDWEGKIRSSVRTHDRNVWIHCASLGEFEQGRPVIEAVKEKHPEYKIILTFFSPSGYEIRKNYDKADLVLYLPADTPGNAKRFLDLVNPQFAVFVKYEFWHNYISGLAARNIPLYLISGIFRPGQHFFRWYGSFFRKILGRFTMFFVQDQRSADLLRGTGMDNVMVTGDTRFDRVMQIVRSAREITLIEEFRGNEKLFLAGSSWNQDEEIIARYINTYPGRMKWVFAPHEIHAGNISRLEKLFKVKTVRYSSYTTKDRDARVLIIDNIGLLSSAYRYACVAAVGGGFGKGIHNILEAACWGLPVMFGPKYQKFMEAVELIKQKGAASFNSYDEFSVILDKWLFDDELYRKTAETASLFVDKNIGATDKILSIILPKTC